MLSYKINEILQEKCEILQELAGNVSTQMTFFIPEIQLEVLSYTVLMKLFL